LFGLGLFLFLNTLCFPPDLCFHPYLFHLSTKVSSGLLGKNKGLVEFLEFGGLVGGFANDLDDDVVKGSLRVSIRDADFVVLEVIIIFVHLIHFILHWVVGMFMGMNIGVIE
jgi:hypothetical protein